MKRMTEKQEDFYDFVQDFVASKGYFPTYRECAEGLSFKSHNSVQQNLKALQKKGWLKHTPKRGWHITPRFYCMHCGNEISQSEHKRLAA